MTKTENYLKYLELMKAYKTFTENLSVLSIDGEYEERLEKALEGLEYILSSYYPGQPRTVKEEVPDADYWFSYKKENPPIEKIKEIYISKNNFFRLLYDYVKPEEIANIQWPDYTVTDVVLFLTRL